MYIKFWKHDNFQELNLISVMQVSNLREDGQQQGACRGHPNNEAFGYEFSPRLT